VRVETPRDRQGSFEPQILPKRTTRFAGFDDKIIALYARGMSVRDIQAHLGELYGVEVGRDLISRVTDAVMEEVRAWQQRPLEDLYPVVFLDCLVIKVREAGSVQRRACYLALGVTLEGDRDVLGIWFQETEGAKFWLQVLNDLKQRGVQDILIACVDGLKGFPEAIEAVFPQAWVQTCIVHLIRHSLRYVPRREREQVARDLRPIYTAVDADTALQALEEFDDKWGERFPADQQELAAGLGAGHPVPGVPAASQTRDLHHQRDRGAEPAAAQSDQDQGTLPQPRSRPQADLPRDQQRDTRPDEDPQLDGSAAGVQDPLRRPTARLDPLTQKIGRSRA
jgi:putative transposase